MARKDYVPTMTHEERMMRFAELVPYIVSKFPNGLTGDDLWWLLFRIDMETYAKTGKAALGFTWIKTADGPRPRQYLEEINQKFWDDLNEVLPTPDDAVDRMASAFAHLEHQPGTSELHAAAHAILDDAGDIIGSYQQLEDK